MALGSARERRRSGNPFAAHPLKTFVLESKIGFVPVFTSLSGLRSPKQRMGCGRTVGVSRDLEISIVNDLEDGLLPAPRSIIRRVNLILRVLRTAMTFILNDLMLS